MANREKEEGDNTLTSLIEYITDEDSRKIDLSMTLEVADRINSSKQECREAAQAITKVLGCGNGVVTKNTIDLLESLIKNCNQRFQYEMCNKKFVEVVLKLLKKKRGKAGGFWGKIISDSDENLPYIEKKLVYLVQLWADTFMMHEDEFKPIIECYRLLRKEGVPFPARDPNEKFMINFQGITSPVYLVLENTTSPTATGTTEPESNSKISKSASKKKEKEKPKEQPKSTDKLDDEVYYASHEGTDISEDEVLILKGSMSVLKEIADNSVHPSDMKSEIAKEILGDLVEVQKKLTRIIKHEKLTRSTQRRVLFELDYEINESIASYKSKYTYLKEQLKLGNKVTNSSAKDVLGSANKSGSNSKNEQKESTQKTKTLTPQRQRQHNQIRQKRQSLWKKKNLPVK